MVLWYDVKLATGYNGSRAFWEELQCRPRSAAICAQLGTAWWELQSDLQLVTTFSGFGGTWERLSCELRPAAHCAGLVLFS